MLTGDWCTAQGLARDSQGGRRCHPIAESMRGPAPPHPLTCSSSSPPHPLTCISSLGAWLRSTARSTRCATRHILELEFHSRQKSSSWSSCSPDREATRRGSCWEKRGFLEGNKRNGGEGGRG